MWTLALLSLIFLIAVCVLLIVFYSKNKNKRVGSKKILVSRKEYQAEKKEIEEYTEKSISDIKETINLFIDENKLKFDAEKDHEKKSQLLKEIRKDVQLITNSFAWERIISLGKEKEFSPFIEQLKKQRPSKWEKII